MTTWNADFYDNKEDTTPSHSTVITADTQDDAAEIARGQMGHANRVDVTKVNPKPNPNLAGVNTAAVDKFLANLPGRKDRE